MIQLRSVYKSFQIGNEHLVALNNINLTIQGGEFVAVMGPSGSGKTTLANVIGGLDRPSMGAIQVDDQELSQLNDQELSEYRNKKIGFIFQSFNLLAGYTALENVMMPLTLAGVPSAIRTRKAYDLLKKVGLENRSKHLPHQLSGGERQRVSIVRALANDPKVVIADEPTGNLDSKKTVEIMKLLKTLHTEQKLTLLVITHDWRVAQEASLILHMLDGGLSKLR